MSYYHSFAIIAYMLLFVFIFFIVFINRFFFSFYIDLGIVRVSLRAQFVARKVLFHCAGFEGINLEHGSKLWLDGCVILNSVGSAIHVNTGCKCLLTQTNIINCGEGDWQIIHGQGAIVIYGTDVNYAEHLVTILIIYLN